MKITMINDCAHVGETILKYLPEAFEKTHIKRGRALLDKTLGLAYKILNAKGDIYHVHYLLQDCYLALKLGKKPTVGHAHGSDLRSSLKHKVWGRVVRHNLKYCDKILVSTPDILNTARRFCEDAKYIPNPVDTELFYPKPLEPHEGKTRVFLASSCNWEVKGIDKVIRALSKLNGDVKVFAIRYGKDFARSLALASSLGLSLNILPKTSHQNMREYYWNSDLVIGSIGAGSLSMTALEAIASGRPVIAYASSKYDEYRDFPLKDVKTVEKIVAAVKRASPKLWKVEYNYFKKHHKTERTINKLCEIYTSLIQ